jgi:hypothetical protein
VGLRAVERVKYGVKAERGFYAGEATLIYTPR